MICRPYQIILTLLQLAAVPRPCRTEGILYHTSPSPSSHLQSVGFNAWPFKKEPSSTVSTLRSGCVKESMPCSKVAAPSYVRTLHASTQDGHTHTQYITSLIQWCKREGRRQIWEIVSLLVMHNSSVIITTSSLPKNRFEEKKCLLYFAWWFLCC